MFTICPDCSRQYRINASQLTSANGQVRCGHCGRQFNAMEALTDKPVAVKPSTSAKPGSPGWSPLIERSQEQFEREPQFDIPINGPAMESPPLPDDPDEVEPDELPESLQEEEPPAKSGNRWLWGLVVLALALVIVGQLAWFNRDTLLQRYPELRPLAEKICDRFDCNLYRHRDVSSINILNRDVRIHPTVEDALLVNATMINQSARVQPFPDIQFSLFDTNGVMLASRLFGPEEYLDESIHINDGMTPEQPVHFVLEVSGPVEGAVSFEFNFL